MFDLNLVKPFLSVYQQRSIIKAAESLELTQPAVSAAIKRFEAVVGYSLFVRVGRSIEPTSMAHKLAGQLSSALELMEGAVSRKRDFTVYMPANLLHKMPMLNGVQLVESPVSVECIVEDIRLNRVDLVVDSGLPKQVILASEFATTDRLLLMSDPEVSNFGEQISMDEFLAARHVTLKLLRQDTQIVDFLSEKSFTRDVAIEVRNPTNLILAVKGTDYIAAVSVSMVHLAKTIGLQIHEPPFSMRPVEFELFYHKKYQTNGHHREMREKIKHLLNN
ncbi:LysR family transcriptional regulator [Vibrio crassostreae]|nr:LysR family transcriptional regulator [Vibrio crassostreae]CAK2274992.1 LysR family transcriptional regulator [Vibrio crassostreae]CAK2406897.1 LysR family transcriptional regulator [Vibrio crassostreae]CAK2628096.1 LysR family transcriptional regulator [Vibrio crassostreae]